MVPYSYNCDKCLNRKNCEHRGNYEKAQNKLREFMHGNSDVEFYGTVRMHCDYYYFDESTEPRCCCS